MIPKEKLEELLLGERKTVQEVANIIGIHRNTLSVWIRQYGIDITSWWRYQSVHCTRCGAELDPDRELTPRRRKALITREHKLCPECKVIDDRRKNTEKQRRWRERNRDHYNDYMKEYRDKRDAYDEKESND